MTDRCERLRAFLAAFDETDVVWGESDCCMLPARWVEQERGCKLAMPRYASRAAALRLIRKAGSLLNLWTPVLAEAGLSMTDQPEIGDVCVHTMTDIEFGGVHDVGGIHCGGGEVLQRATPRSVVRVVPKMIIRSWRVAKVSPLAPGGQISQP